MRLPVRIASIDFMLVDERCGPDPAVGGSLVEKKQIVVAFRCFKDRSVSFVLAKAPVRLRSLGDRDRADRYVGGIC